MSEMPESLMKSIFRGEIPEQLVFPYPRIDPDEADMVRIIQENLLRWGAEHHDAARADAEGKDPDSTFEALAELGFFGWNIPEEYGGLELSMTGFARIYSTVSELDGSLPVILGAHASIGLKGLLLYGTPEQKRKFLPDLASG